MTAPAQPGTPLAPSAAPTSRTRSVARGMLGMVVVGSSVGVSRTLTHAPLFAAQGVRYAVAIPVLLILARTARAHIVRPRSAEWFWLAGIAALGLVLFNVAIVRGVAHAQPAAIAVALALVPILLGVAVPVLPRHGAWGVSVHSVWMGTTVLIVLSTVTEGPAAVGRLTAADWAAVGYLAVMVTAVAFLLWYSTVAALGPGPVGLLTGIAPISAALTGMLTGGRAPGPLVWLGLLVVVCGLATGLRAPRRAARPSHQAQPPRTAPTEPQQRELTCSATTTRSSSNTQQSALA